jgi:hypothetical protein
VSPLPSGVSAALSLARMKVICGTVLSPTIDTAELLNSLNTHGTSNSKLTWRKNDREVNSQDESLLLHQAR